MNYKDFWDTFLQSYCSNEICFTLLTKLISGPPEFPNCQNKLRKYSQSSYNMSKGNKIYQSNNDTTLKNY